MKLQSLLHSEDLEKYKGNFTIFLSFLWLCTDFFSYSNRRKIVGFFSFLMSVALEKGTPGFLLFLTTIESGGSSSSRKATQR